jgi:FlgD Ig-like domain
MTRLLSMALVVGLLVATAAAFAVTENLKLTKSPIWRTRVVAPDQVHRRRAAALAFFSPVCRCRTASVALQFSLRHADRLTLDVVDAARRPMLRLLRSKPESAGPHTFVWFGRTGEGTVAPDGAYLFQVKLADARRTILLPNRVRVDTSPPRVLTAKPNHPDFSPDGDHQSDSVRIHYALSEPGHALLFLRGRQIVKTKSGKPAGSFVWGGIQHGVPMPQGTYYLRVGAVDVAGNVAGPKHGVPVVVHIRYISLARHEIPAIAARTRFGVGVQTGAPIYDWRFGGRTGSASERVLVLRAPRKPGRYRLVVSEGGHSDVAFVEVVPRS